MKSDLEFKGNGQVGLVEKILKQDSFQRMAWLVFTAVPQVKCEIKQTIRLKDIKNVNFGEEENVNKFNLTDKVGLKVAVTAKEII